MPGSGHVCSQNIPKNGAEWCMRQIKIQESTSYLPLGFICPGFPEGKQCCDICSCYKRCAPTCVGDPRQPGSTLWEIFLCPSKPLFAPLLYPTGAWLAK